MKWTHITVKCRKNDSEKVQAIMSMVDAGLEIEDFSDVEENLMQIYGELIDESILHADRSVCKIGLYLSEEKDPEEALRFLEMRFAEEKLSLSPSCETIDEEDWADNWKQYYKPLRVGRHIVIRPPWEECALGKDDIEVVMDPGMAFGTGTHETTRLCLTLLEKYLRKGDRVLDVGTGSGILSIAAVKLGAASADAYDLDPTAVRVANENFAANGVDDRAVCAVSDLLGGVDRARAPFDFVCANIVADILLRMAPDVSSFMARGGRLAVSGVIEERRDDVVGAMERGGLTLTEELREADWCAILFTRK